MTFRFSTTFRSSLSGLAAIVITGLAIQSNVQAADELVNFNREVRPILSDMCYKCHGPDAAERKAGLRLDEFAGATTKLESGDFAVVPGKPEDSTLLSRVHSTDDSVVMPPPETGRKLNA
jgi:hypothetical protein